MTPYELSLLLDCYTGRELREVPTTVRDETLAGFVRNGLIDSVENHQATDRAKVHIEYLLTRRWPVMQWVHLPESE